MKTNIPETLTQYSAKPAFIEKSGPWESGPYRVIAPSTNDPGAVGHVVAQGEKELCELFANALNTLTGAK